MEIPPNRSHHFWKTTFLALYQKSRCLTIARCLSYTIWTVGLVVLVGLAINDFIPLLDTYQQKNRATQADVVIVDDSFKPPQIMIQFPAYKIENMQSEALWEIAMRFRDGTVTDPNCTICRKLEEVGWDVWRGFSEAEFAKSDISAGYESLSLAFVRRYYESMDHSEDALDTKFSRWNEPIVSSLLNLFYWQNIYDYFMIPKNEENIVFYPPANSLSCALDNYQDTAKIDLLFSRTLKAICRMILFTESNSWNEAGNYNRTNRTCMDFLLNSPAPVAFDDDGLYVAIPVIAELKPTIFEWTLLGYPNSTNSLWIPTNGQKQEKFWIYPETSVLYYSSSESLYSPSIYEVPVNYGKYGHKVTVRYSIKMRAKETRLGQKCHNETTAAACVNKCMSSWIIKICGCVPFITRVGLDYDHSLHYCDPMTYIGCIPDKKDSKMMQQKCRNRCKSACEYTAYNWRINHEFTIPDKPNTVEFSLRMLPVFNTFPQFNWIQKDTPEQFLSQVGGLIGGYLGLSAVSLLTFAMACIEVMKRFFFGRNEAESQIAADIIQLAGRNSTEELEKNMRHVIDDVIREHLTEFEQKWEFGRWKSRNSSRISVPRKKCGHLWRQKVYGLRVITRGTVVRVPCAWVCMRHVADTPELSLWDADLKG